MIETAQSKPESKPDEVEGSLDAVRGAKCMKSIDAAMRRYFESEDWLRARERQFPGPSGQYWLRPKRD